MAIYWPVCRFDFVQYDDPEYVSKNSTVQAGITAYGLVWCFVDAHVCNWHPVTWISHMLDCQVFGLNPGAHHLVNVAFHCANSALLFLLLQAMTGAFWRSALVAAIFAWHPLRVESVAWISERKDVLSGFFFMLTLLAYVRYAKDPNSSSRLQVPSSHPHFSFFNFQCSIPIPSSSWYFLSLGFFTLGLLSKPMLVTVPFILLLVDFWPLIRFPENSATQHNSRIPRSCVFEKIPFCLLSLAIGGLTLLAQKSGGAILPIKSEGLGARVGTTLTGYLAYLEQSFWPHDLACLYLRPQAQFVFPVVCAGFGILAVSIIAVLALRTRPYLAVGWFWFLLMLLPVSGLVQAGLQSRADRYTYLPMIGLALSLTWGVQELLVTLRWNRAAQWILAGGLTTLLLACALLTRHQLAYWQNTETLMEHALQIDPNNYVAHQNLGAYYSSLGMGEAAKAHRQRVRELDPALRGLAPTVSVP